MATVPDIVPISDLRQDASGVIKRAAASQQPVFITQRGRAAAVMVSTFVVMVDMASLDMPAVAARAVVALRSCLASAEDCEGALPSPRATPA